MKSGANLDIKFVRSLVKEGFHFNQSSHMSLRPNSVVNKDSQNIGDFSYIEV